MTSYLVHVPATAEPGATAGLDRAVLVKDRFHWLAFLFPFLWLIYQRAWLGLLGYVVAVLAVVGLETLAGLPDQTQGLSLLLLNIALGVFAGDIRSWTLSRRGLRFVDIVAADGEDAAARRFYDRWLSPQAQPRAVASGAARPAGPSPYQPVVGLFPEAGRS
jgi:hypothetical protein